MWKCFLHIPHSFNPNDFLVIQTEGVGRTKDEASEQACLRALAILFLRNPDGKNIVLHAAQWSTTIVKLKEEIHQVLQQQVPQPRQDHRFTAAIHRILHECGGEFIPESLSLQLRNELTEHLPGGELASLKDIIEAHPEFSIFPCITSPDKHVITLNHDLFTSVDSFTFSEPAGIQTVAAVHTQRSDAAAPGFASANEKPPPPPPGIPSVSAIIPPGPPPFIPPPPGLSLP